MKNRKVLFGIVIGLMALQWLVTVVLLIFAPDIVPHRLDSAVAGGAIYGSKFIWLIFPIVTTFLGCLFIFFSRASKKRGDAEEEKATLQSAIPALVLWNFLWLIFMASAFYQ